MSGAMRRPVEMDLPEFLAWDAPDGPRWQLVDGQPLAMAPAARTPARIQSRLAALIDTHLTARHSACTVLTAPGVVPRVRSETNFRVPDLGVTCSPYTVEELMIQDPILLVEILSPGNRAQTWTNVWAYTTIPSVREILIVHSTAVKAELLRRDAAGNWPERTAVIESGALDLASIGLAFDLAAIYQGTRLVA
jgi:Uma2 family endonuclease